MELLSEDDLNLRDMTPEELDRAWDLWFDLAQATNDSDPPYTHGVFVLYEKLPVPDVPVQPSSAPVSEGEEEKHHGEKRPGQERP
jgi:hypothetical protein